jgi:hypothetical protein
VQRFCNALPAILARTSPYRVAPKSGTSRPFLPMFHPNDRARGCQHS